MRFLIDTGAEISVVNGTNLRPEINYEPTKGISIKGISTSVYTIDRILGLICTLFSFSFL